MNSEPAMTRVWIARTFTIVEDIVYVGLGLLLAASALALLVHGGVLFAENIGSGMFAQNIIGLLDSILLILLVVEILYTVQISFREHTLSAEPFLLIGVIAVIRRVLVITAEFAHAAQTPVDVFNRFILELAVLTILILVLAFSLVIIRRQPVTADRA